MTSARVRNTRVWPCSKGEGYGPFSSVKNAEDLNHLSVNVKDGKLTGLMGPTGSGKSFFLRSLVGRLPPNKRAILADMKPLHILSSTEIANAIAAVAQDSEKEPAFSVRDFVMMARSPFVYGPSVEMKVDEEIAREALVMTDTWHLAMQPFAELNETEKQLVLIARAMSLQPKLLLLDETVVYLDADDKSKIMDLLRNLSRTMPLSLITVLHEVDLAARYCDEITFLDQGIVVAMGPPNQVLTANVLRDAYGIDVVVSTDPITHMISVRPRASHTITHRGGIRVHLLCGGGTGGALLEALRRSGCSVSVGVLSMFDSDYKTARELHVPTVAEVPFSQISQVAHSENLRLIAESEAVVVLPFPVGQGNLRNLKAAGAALQWGKKVFLLRPEGRPSIDFVGGKAEAFIRDLIASGAVEMKSVEEIIPKLLKRGELTEEAR